MIGVLLSLALWLAVLLVPFHPDSIASATTSTIVTDQSGHTLRAYLSQDERWRLPARVDAMSPWVIKATLAVEDKRFHNHWGIDPVAILRATLSNIRRGRVVSGASTITMQTAGLTDEPQRTFLRKLRQAFRALQLERHWSKKQILEFYLTHVPLGGNVCGIEAAARRYFNKGANELSLSEAALLAGLPQSPTRLRPDRNYEAAMKRRAHVLKRMLENGDISRDDYSRVLPQRPPVGQFDAPVAAAHLCDMVHARYANLPVVRTTIERDVQQTAEHALREKVTALASAGVTNGSVVVLDVRTGNVLALVGSVNYEDKQAAGQVNGAMAGRSPGSTLKPFLYALAYEQGAMVPATVMADVPQLFSEYRPDNFDLKFQGLVNADQALAWSLNIPAVSVLRTVGVPDALRHFRRSGLQTMRGPAEKYGLSMAIGTCSARLLELANAYAVLARGGVYLPYRFIQSSSSAQANVVQPQESRLLSEGTCYFINRALADETLRPPEDVSADLHGLKNVAWKTGTSSGFKDAWTFAYNDQFVVGVWIGNMDGRSSRALVGSQAAAPVALSLMDNYRKLRAGARSWPVKPADVVFTELCSATGLATSDYCSTTCSAECLAPFRDTQVAQKLRACAVHKSLTVDTQTSTLLCTRCLGGRSRTDKVFAIWPTAVSAWLNGTGQTDTSPPPHFAGCTTLSPYTQPRIISPASGDKFIIAPDRDSQYQKVSLEAHAAPHGSRLYWFLNSQLIQVSEAGITQAFANLKLGAHILRCVDDFGRSDTINFSVEEN